MPLLGSVDGFTLWRVAGEIRVYHPRGHWPQGQALRRLRSGELQTLAALPKRVILGIKAIIRRADGFASHEPRCRLYPTWVKDYGAKGGVRQGYLVKFPSGHVRDCPMGRQEARDLCRDKGWLVEVKQWNTE